MPVHDGPMRAVSLVNELVVLDAPGGSPVATVEAKTAFGTATVLGVAAPPAGDGWVSVQVPTRPNGLQGWVQEADVRLEPLTTEIFVDLTARTLRLVDGGAEVGTWSIAIGRPDRPTPTGRFFITDKLATGDPDSVWGANAVGISAFSDVLTDFIGGIGQIGIHGTNNPDSIGQAASSGCIRLPNEVIDALIERLPLGTPVHIA
jgi:lipoprotein-anchoring transpeptidase ErfK/SrfK